jgi:hypothetical protein
VKWRLSASAIGGLATTHSREIARPEPEPAVARAGKTAEARAGNAFRGFCSGGSGELRSRPVAKTLQRMPSGPVEEGPVPGEMPNATDRSVGRRVRLRYSNDC